MSAPPKSCYILHRADVRAQTIFVCSSCGAQERGSTAKFEVQSVEGLQSALDTDPKPHEMPVGWASYHDPKSYVYKCPGCKS